MPTRGTPRKSYRIPPDIQALVEEIAAKQGGLTETAVIINGVKAYHREVFGAVRIAPEKKSKKSLRVS